MRRLRWGLLGTARINRHLIPAIRASSRSRLQAVASRDAARAAAYATEWDIPSAYGSYSDLLASDVDIVYVPLPNALHAPWTLQAVAAGKHVLCEKPLALTPADIDRIAAAAAAHQRIVMEGFMYRHHAQTHAVQQLITEGAIGEVWAISASFSYLRTRSADIRLEPELGGGALWDIGCYGVSFAQLFAGTSPSAVVGIRADGPTGIDEQFGGLVTYANGRVADIFASFRVAYHAAARVLGSTGAIELGQPFRPDRVEEIVVRRDRDIRRIEVRGSAPFVDQIVDMERAALGEKPAGVGLDESRQLTATMEALQRAATSGRRIEVSASPSKYT